LIWDALDGTAKTAAELAALTGLDTKDHVIRQHVKNIRLKLPSSIERKQGFGYYRVDKEPDWPALRPKPRKRPYRAK
jgi:hypothetical protein